MEVMVQYEANKKQALFHQSDATEVIYGGAKGGGKSCALVMEALAYALENAGAVMYIFRETYDDLEANIIREWKEKVPKELYKYNEGKHIASLINGTKVLFRYIRNYQDASDYQGRSMDWIGVDELTKHDYDSIRVLLSCLRSPKGFKPCFRGTCNPGGKGHVWVKERYIVATDYGTQEIIDGITGNKIAFIPAQVYDNEVLMKNDPSYVKRLENLPETQKKAFLYGDWDIFEGQYYPEFRHNIHVVQPFEVPGYWKKFRSLDYGLDMCACYWWAVSDTGREYLYRELHEPNLNLTQAAKRILEMTPFDEKIDYTVGSPDLFNRRQETGYSGAELMNNAGLLVIRADDSRVPGWRALREHLTPYEDEQGVKVSTLQFFSTCVNAIRCIPALLHDDRNIEDAATEPHDITHAPDAIRYGVMSRPPLTRKPIASRHPVGTLEHKVEKHLEKLLKNNRVKGRQFV